MHLKVNTTFRLIEQQNGDSKKKETYFLIL